MSEETPSSARLRRIGRTLRDLRESQRLTLKAAGRRIERSSGSLSLIENGLQPLRLRDLKHILDVYEVPADLHAALMELAHQSRQDGWWTNFKDLLSPPDLDYASLEYDATDLDAFEMGFVPGLLQTEEYARAIMRSDLAEAQPARASRFVAFRMARQRILDKSTPPRLRVVLDEAALRRVRGGPQVMRAQLNRLLDESHRDHVTVQVLPFSCTTDPGVSDTFWTLDIGQPAIFSAVLITHLNGRWILENEADIIRYRDAFERVRAVALSETDSRALIHRVISAL